MFQKLRNNREPKFRAYIASLKCTVFGCQHPSECAHQDQNLGKGFAEKTDDFFSNPLCHLHHLEEGRGAYTFWHKVIAEDDWLLFEHKKAYNGIRAMKWLVSEGRTDEALELLRRFS